MALMTEKVTIAELSKFGFKSNKGEYIDWGPRFTDKSKLVPGVIAELVLYVSDSGKRYVNEIKSPLHIMPVAKTEPKLSVKELTGGVHSPLPYFSKKFTPSKAKEDTTMTKDEWKQKDRSQLLGGLSHDAAELAAVSINVGIPIKEVLEVYREALNGLIEIRNTVK